MYLKRCGVGFGSGRALTAVLRAYRLALKLGTAALSGPRTAHGALRMSGGGVFLGCWQFSRGGSDVTLTNESLSGFTGKSDSLKSA